MVFDQEAHFTMLFPDELFDRIAIFCVAQPAHPHLPIYVNISYPKSCRQDVLNLSLTCRKLYRIASRYINYNLAFVDRDFSAGVLESQEDVHLKHPKRFEQVVLLNLDIEENPQTCLRLLSPGDIHVPLPIGYLDNLRVLVWKMPPFFRNTEFDGIILGKVLVKPHLRVVVLQNWEDDVKIKAPADSGAANATSRFPQIRRLDITEKSLNLIGLMPGLDALSLSFNTRFKSRPSARLLDLVTQVPWKTLTELCISISDLTELQYILEGFKAYIKESNILSVPLKELSIDGSRFSYGDESLKIAIGQEVLPTLAGVSIRAFHLAGCEYISASLLKQIFEAFPVLEEISLISRNRELQRVNNGRELIESLKVDSTKHLRTLTWSIYFDDLPPTTPHHAGILENDYAGDEDDEDYSYSSDSGSSTEGSESEENTDCHSKITDVAVALLPYLRHPDLMKSRLEPTILAVGNALKSITSFRLIGRILHWPEHSLVTTVDYVRESSGSEKEGSLEYNIEILEEIWHPTTSKFTCQAIDELVYGQ